MERIRTEGRPIRVAICTGSTDESLLAKAVEFGAEIVLRKPLDVRALLDWLNAST